MWVELVGRDLEFDAALASCRGQTGGVLIAGTAGIGKTRLLDEVLNHLADDGWHTERFVASIATRGVPFGPLISLLPVDDVDPTQQLARVRHEIQRRSGGRRVLVAVDDAHLLDVGSLACVTDLVHHDETVVALTARTDEDLPPELTALWSSGALTRIDVDLLGAAEVQALAELFLGGPVDAALSQALVERAEGIPLFVRELVLDAKAMGTVEQRDGTWRHAADLRSGTRLRELVAARIAHLDSSSARLVEMVSLAEPLWLGYLTDDEARCLDALEQRGLVDVVRIEGDWVIRIDHPLMSEALRADMSTPRWLELAADLVDRIVRCGPATRSDALRAVGWAELTGVDLPHEVIAAAAREALATLDLDQAADLACQVVANDPFEGHLLLGEVRRHQARAEEAEASLAVAAALADDDEDIVRIAMWRSTLLAHHVGEPAGAIRLLEEAASTVSDPVRALELESEASYLAGLLGRFEDAVRTNRSILARDGLDDHTVWTARINLIYAATMLGRPVGFDEHVAAATTMVESGADVPLEGRDLLWALRTGLTIQQGDLERGEREGWAHVEECSRRGLLHGLSASILLQLLLLRGSPRLVELAERARRDLDVSDPFAVAPIADSCTVLAHVALGDLPRAEAIVATIPESAGDDIRALTFVERARAAVLARRAPDEAASIAAESGRTSIEQSHVSFGVVALYDAARLGRPDLVVDDLAAAAAGSGAPLFDAMSRHAGALSASDPRGLDDVARTFARMTARPLAAEASADAARLHTDPVAARRSAARAARWATMTPVLVSLPEVDAAVSPRELEVAAKAAEGGTSREIADQLYLSVRTVDNHLRQVYAKLGVSSRSELAAVFAA